MRQILIIGVGAGDPDYVTVQAIKALNQADVFFVIDKGAAKDDLVRLRKAICAAHITGDGYRFVEARDPDRDRTAPDYGAAVSAWHDERAAVFERMIAGELTESGPGSCGAFLVWGDPSLYDGTIRIVEQLIDRGTVEFEYQVIPGISSLHALTARHRIPLNRIGEPIQITPGRLLSGGMPPGTDNVVVMLDADCAFRSIDDDTVDIYWGAYLGTPDELLIAGPVTKVGARIEEVRALARARKGWIMDTYLLRRTPRTSRPGQHGKDDAEPKPA